ncbi:hypothetical protein QU42_02965 [Bradyrhizobium sp. UASWS1016]|jgi:exopolysaccharide production protein ExoZ|nr:acyltransferase [Bradyrhizobium sp. UASWS1016]OCX32515.1 hypothetical protein QU42_02965 [Bradyrhizobium sp. UASWS1016]OYU86427.1 MAG: acyltransferase [Bradyrhizobiaceae bacterium PARB1]
MMVSASDWSHRLCSFKQVSVDANRFMVERYARQFRVNEGLGHHVRFIGCNFLIFFMLRVYPLSMTQLEVQPQLSSIQYLRGIAAMMVVFFHANGMTAEYFGSTWSPLGAAGVDIFFVISGFIMWVTTGARRTPASFIQHRIVRVVPLYWCVTLALFSSWVIFRNSTPLPPLENLLKSLLFIPHISARTGQIEPLLIAGWTLNFEMFFYAIFALSLLLSGRYRAILVFSVLTSLVMIGQVFSSSNPVMITYTSPLLLEFALGCLLGLIYQYQLLPRPSLGVTLCILGVVLLCVAGTDSAADLSFRRLLYWGAPSVLIVAGFVSLEPTARDNRLLSLLGA